MQHLIEMLLNFACSIFSSVDAVFSGPLCGGGESCENKMQGMIEWTKIELSVGKEEGYFLHYEIHTKLSSRECLI